MRRSSLLITVLFLFVAQTVFADFIGTVKKGNDAYKKKDYKSALEEYRAAEADNPTSPELDYNIGSALANDGSYEEAIDKLQKALRTQDIQVEAAAHYNMGNTYFRMNNYQNAIKSYEEALKLNPNDLDAKFNLELSRKKLKEQLKPQQDPNSQNKSDSTQQQQDQQQQDQQNQQNQNQDQKDQQQQNQAQQDQQNKDQQQQQQQQQMGQPKQMSKEDAERLLNALKDDEQDIQKKLRRSVKGGDYTGKDW
ncbi:MAG: tetratricopeptide repeat protein [bacterium]|nr:tetratricopeptide repeat protein [bacterium]